MGLCISAEEKELKARSNKIDKQIEEDSRRFKKECKILLLGSGESGKSTIVKQMKIIHQNGYTKEELAHYRITVYKNLMDSAQAIVYAMKKFQLEPRKSINRVYAEKILEYYVESDPNFQLNPEIVEAIDSVWNDPIISEVLDKQNLFYLMDSAPYFFGSVKRIGAQSYIPNETDVLRARTKTTGIMETRFTMDILSIHMFDVGGQRSERKKWIHCFEAVTSIIFCVALSEYDQVLLEESGQVLCVFFFESLVLFESVINSRWFLRTSIILFLNKIDLFKAKLPRVPLSDYFPEYTGLKDLQALNKLLGETIESYYVNLLVIFVCSSIGSSNCFLLSKKYGRTLVKDRYNEKLDRLANQIQTHSRHLLNYIVVLRLSPFPPNWFANLAAPHLGIPLKTFFIGTFFGVAPPSFIHVQAGLTINNITNDSDFEIFTFKNISVLILVGAAVLLPVWYRKKVESRSENSDLDSDLEDTEIEQQQQKHIDYYNIVLFCKL
ncbi:9907_t:CDS:2 [Entrophospora sp. SA101]|nr:9907_t:CDS:2 [Entrophospora sp. SA101]